MSSFQILSETQPVAVAILDIEIAATVFLVADLPRDLYTLGLELVVQRVGVFDPDVGVPAPALRIDRVIGAHRAGLGDLTEHDDDAAALDHAETRWLTPEAIVVKTELVAVEVGGLHYVVDDEKRGDGPGGVLGFAAHVLALVKSRGILPPKSPLGPEAVLDGEGKKALQLAASRTPGWPQSTTAH